MRVLFFFAKCRGCGGRGVGGGFCFVGKGGGGGGKTPPPKEEHAQRACTELQANTRSANALATMNENALATREVGHGIHDEL